MDNKFCIPINNKVGFSSMGILNETEIFSVRLKKKQKTYSLRGFIRTISGSS